MPGQWHAQGKRPYDQRGLKHYRLACLEWKQRIRDGRHNGMCHFHGMAGFDRCPGRIDLALPTQDRWAFTAHHLQRLMDGGQPNVGVDDLAPAHRSCNAADGLRAQNARRHPGRTPRRRPDLQQDPTSHDW